MPLLHIVRFNVKMSGLFFIERLTCIGVSLCGQPSGGFSCAHWPHIFLLCRFNHGESAVATKPEKNIIMLIYNWQSNWNSNINLKQWRRSFIVIYDMQLRVRSYKTKQFILLMKYRKIKSEFGKGSKSNLQPYVWWIIMVAHFNIVKENRNNTTWKLANVK